jgi:tRNA 2-thiouridine synthesizing protein A
VEHLIDVRGLRCPIPLFRARAALAQLGVRDTLIVLADDPEAPIDLAALALDTGRDFAREGERISLAPAQQ